MNEKQGRAVQLFLSGCNCCQAVAAVFCGEYGISEEIVLRMGAAFGGGMRCGEVCGAVSGALMALGMKYGQTRPDDAASKETANAKTKEFMEAFEKRHGVCRCRDLLAGRYWKDVCGNFVADAVALLGEFGV